MMDMITLRRNRTVLLASLVLLTSTGYSTTILFIGNSFTFAHGSAVNHFHPETVTDLNHEGIGGIPALFKEFTTEANCPYDVSLETSPGKGLDYHVREKADVIGKAWDTVVMHGYSTLDARKPGDPDLLVRSATQVANLLHDKNSKVEIHLMATWTRADQIYNKGGHWFGQPIFSMAKDLRAGYDKAAQACPFIKDVIPVGEAWNRAIQTGFADQNPYDGIEAGKVDLWATDHYHASMYGSYIEALTVFGDVTGVDPRSLGPNEEAAKQLSITPQQAGAMQKIAFDQLIANGSKNLRKVKVTSPGK